MNLQLHHIAKWARAQDPVGRAFKLSWGPAAMVNYFSFHILQGTFLSCPGALLCYWQVDPKKIDQGFRGQSPWPRTNPFGIGIYMDILLSDGVASCSPLVEDMKRRFPAWRNFRWFGWRNHHASADKLVEYPVERFFRRLTRNR
jgi:hypothetical protein